MRRTPLLLSVVEMDSGEEFNPIERWTGEKSGTTKRLTDEERKKLERARTSARLVRGEAPPLSQTQSASRPQSRSASTTRTRAGAKPPEVEVDPRKSAERSISRAERFAREAKGRVGSAHRLLARIGAASAKVGALRASRASPRVAAGIYRRAKEIGQETGADDPKKHAQDLAAILRPPEGETSKLPTPPVYTHTHEKTGQTFVSTQPKVGGYKSKLVASRLYRQPLLVELFTSAIPRTGPSGGRLTHLGGPAPKSATTTGSARPVGGKYGALYLGRTWERLLAKKLEKKDKQRDGDENPPLPVGGVVAGMDLAKEMRKRLGLSEAATSGVSSWPWPRPLPVKSFDLTEFDHVARLAEWRKQCPDYGKQGHASFCRRCDESAWMLPTGGAKWAKQKGWTFENPLQGYPAWDSIPDNLEPMVPSEVTRRIPKD